MSGLNFHPDVGAGKGSCLHLLMSSSTDTVRACLRHAGAGDSILLLDKAVSLLLEQSWTLELPEGVRIFVAQADVQARALPELAEPGEMIDDRAWAELVSRYPHCLSWK